MYNFKSIISNLKWLKNCKVSAANKLILMEAIFNKTNGEQHEKNVVFIIPIRVINYKCYFEGKLTKVGVKM